MNELTVELTEGEAKLVKMLAEHGGDFERAALACGYASSGISALKWRVTRKPAFLAAMHLETARLVQDAAPAALKLITDLIRSEAAPVKVRLDAAKTLLDRAGHIAPRARAQGDGQEKTLGEMTLDELKETQERLQAEILNRARPVNAQETPAITDESIDLVG